MTKPDLSPNTPPSSSGVFQTGGDQSAAQSQAGKRPFFVRSSSLALSAALGLGLLVPLAVPAIFTATQAAQAAEAVVPDSFVPPPGFEDLVEAVMPAVVSVQVRTAAPVETSNRDIDRLPEGTPFDRFFRRFGPEAEEFFRRGPGNGDRRPNRPRGGEGSGFFISEDGFLVTNNHVVDGADEVTVVMQDGTELEAQVLGTDSRTDLALLKVDGADFTFVRLADAQPRIGERVIAIGNPFGLGGSVTSGIVSQQGRDIQPGPFDEFLQIDAAINRGNSGGPTFNMRGEVVGVNTAIFSPSGGNVGIAFAVPSTLVQDVIGDLIETGAVARGWLGVNIQAVTEQLAEGIGREGTEGAIIISAASGSPADMAGLQSGDTILQVDGQIVQGPTELARLISNFDPGEIVELLIWRDGEPETIPVELGLLPSERELASTFRAPELDRTQPGILDQLGVTIAPAEAVGRDGNGLVVTEVEPGSVADDRDLREGDMIVEIAGQQVQSMAEVQRALRAAARDGQASALVRVEDANGTSRFVALPTDRG
ncbi:MAG: trypsin-like peptidase domain-containing protein [Pseudomonadota bacterium]